ncbi:MAG: metal ABC transporter substrate-binding protein [Alphaproteobacteria bacterium]|nr:metal ABC transporter substrate-binding protein [Alphaproteobacteria bacterium]
MRIIIIIIIIAINNVAMANNQPLKINAGIIPIGSLLAMLNTGINNSIGVILANQNMSPHEAAINVKEMQAIKDSNVLVLVNRNFEYEIAENINKDKTQVIYLDKLLKHVSADPHFWLDANIAKEILQELAVELGKIDPKNAKAYLKNAAKFSAEIADMQKSLQKDFTSVKSHFMVYHEAWNYFIKANGLTNYYKGSITRENSSHHDIDTALGVQDIINLANFVKKNNVVCIFIEPQFDDAVLMDFIVKHNIKTAVLNPIGEITNPLSDSYFLMMRENARQLKSCAS